MDPTKILLVGTGAVGSYFGGKLVSNETQITAYCRSDYEIVKEKGLVVRSYKGDFLFEPHEVVNDLSKVEDETDYVIVCLKVLPEINLPELIRPVVGKNTAIVLIQNGIGIEKTIQNAFPENTIISGIAFIAISRVELGVSRHTGSGMLVLGDYPKGAGDKTRRLADLYQKAEVPCTISEDINEDRWKKMMWNASFNPISVLGGKADSKMMVEIQESELLVRSVMHEVMAIAKSEGYSLDDKIIDNTIKGNRKMRPFKTSMLVDFEQGRPMEIDAILGNAIEIAKTNNVPTPHLQTLYSLMKLHSAPSESTQEQD